MEHSKAQEAAEFLRQKVRCRPVIGIICGSGLGGLAERVQSPEYLPTIDIPHLKSSTVEGHAGKLVFGQIGGKSIVAVQGRIHIYEGYSVHDTVRVVRILALLGVKVLIVTNAAGGINQSYKVGDLMVISDHINLPGMVGVNPLRGPNESEFGGPRFLPTNNVYPHHLRHIFFQIADSTQLQRAVHEGTYTMLSGPTYESAAEVRLVAGLGGDAVGMSSVPEVITAVHSNMEVLGLSLITNVAIESKPRSGRQAPTHEKVEEPDHSEVVEVAAAAAKDIERLVMEFIKRL